MYILKTIIVTVAVLFAINIVAQIPTKIVGLYLTPTNFQNNIVSYSVNQNDVKKIFCNSFFSSKEFKIIKQGKKVNIPKKDVFAFLTNDSLQYRVYNNLNYLLISVNDSFVLFKSISQMPFIGRTNATPYYFSKSIVGDLFVLTKQNIFSHYNFSAMQIEQFNKTFEYNTDLANINTCNNQLLIYNYLKN